MTSLAHPLPRYFGWIDAMRGIAALSVVIFHYAHFYMADADARPLSMAISDFPYAAVLGMVFDIGEEAVRLFWVISGFVFAHVYWDRTSSARSFAVARIARLYPLHLATLLFVAAVQTISMASVGHWQIFGDNDPWHFAQQLVLLDHALGYSEGPSFNGPVWSVSAEIFAYLVFFLTLPLTKRAPLAASLLLMAASYVALTLRPESFVIGQWALVCGVFFFAGSSCFALLRLLGGTPWPVLIASLAFVGLAVAGQVLGSANAVLIATCCAIVMGLAALETIAAGVGRSIRFLGDISYSVYLVHVPIQMVVLLVADIWFDGSRTFAHSHITLPLYLGASIAVAYGVHIWFERPVGRWIRARL